VSWPTPRGGTGWGASPPPGDVPAGRPAAPWAERGRGRWWLVAIVLTLAAAAAFAVGLTDQQRSLGGPVITAGKPAGTPGIKPTARSVPVALSIPAIGLSVPVSELGLNPDHTVQVPTNFQEPGWYEFGPSPGQLGSSVILGHVDSYKGPAVFFQLRTLRPGDRVYVSLADGVITQFEVQRIAMYLKANFPTLQVYGSHGYSALQLVTCGGVFDSQTGHYLSNVVVYTSLVSTS
jgi:LPXTG-site transpeptidase (sortase) family protein